MAGQMPGQPSHLLIWPVSQVNLLGEKVWPKKTKKKKVNENCKILKNVAKMCIWSQKVSNLH
jgi:hypothetical protein